MLGEICTFKYGKALPESSRNGGAIPVFGSNGVVGCHDSAITVGQTIVIGRKGSFGEVNYSSGPSWPIDTAYFVDGSATSQDIRWLYHRLGALGLNAMNKAAAVPGLNREDAYRKQLLVPPLPEQRRIAAILDQAEALRAKRREALAQLDHLTQAIFVEMFGDDSKGEPKFPLAALAEVLESPLQNGAYFPKEEYASEGGVEMVHMSDAFNGIVRRGGLKRVNCSDTDLQKYSLSSVDILLARRSLTYEGAAKPCLVPQTDEPLIFESSFIRVTPAKKKLSVIYLFHYLGNEAIRGKRVRPFVTQSTISGINQSNLERVQVVLPPLPLQQTFATRIQAIEALKAAHCAALADLDALFTSLQHRAFRGEL